jgi:ethanolaminephosphotransferase
VDCERKPNLFSPHPLLQSIGFLVPVVTYSIGHYYSPTLGCDGVPSWFYLLSAASMFFYQTMDNMDGKQARRTNSSSPLGEIFDHGCDALNSFFSGITFGVTCCCGTENPALLSVVLLVPSVVFFTGTFEAYHTGTLVLPVFNGPSEGLLIIMAANFMTFYHGQEWWSWPCPLLPPFLSDVVRVHTYLDAMMAVSSLFLVVTAAAQIVGIPRLYYKRGARGFEILKPLAGLLPMVWVAVWGGLWMAHSGGLLHRRVRAFSALLYCLFAESVVAILVAHVTKSPLSTLRTLALPLPCGFILSKYVNFNELQQVIRKSSDVCFSPSKTHFVPRLLVLLKFYLTLYGVFFNHRRFCC